MVVLIEKLSFFKKHLQGFIISLTTTSVPIMRPDINKNAFSTFLKRTGLSKRLSTIVATKKL